MLPEPACHERTWSRSLNSLSDSGNLENLGQPVALSRYYLTWYSVFKEHFPNDKNAFF